MLSKETKLRLVHAVADQRTADEIEKRLIADTPANASESEDLFATFNQSLNSSIEEKLKIALAGDDRAAAGREIAQKINAMAKVIQNHANPSDVPAVAATATFDLTEDIILTSAAAGADRNTDTFTIEVEAAAANDDDEVLVVFTGTEDAIVCTITPNDGTNNAATPVDLTTEELVELINTGAVAGKNVVVTDVSDLRELQTAEGGDATALADAGEGDGEVATFADGADADDADTDTAQSEMGDEPMSAKTFEALVSALASRAAAEEFKAAYNAMIEAVMDITA